MALRKQICPWVIALSLGGCTFLSVEEPDAVVDTNAVVDIDVDGTDAVTEIDVDGVNSVTDAMTEIDVDGVNSVVEIKFVEGAPKDRFVITNVGSCGLDELTLELDLSPSAGMLIFDTSATGAGVEVFQPFEAEDGNSVQLVADTVDDGDAGLALNIAALGPGDRASFTIDVDDTLPRSDLGQIRVADSEISGAIASITLGNSETIVTEFNGSLARATLPACSSVQ